MYNHNAEFFNDFRVLHAGNCQDAFAGFHPAEAAFCGHLGNPHIRSCIGHSAVVCVIRCAGSAQLHALRCRKHNHRQPVCGSQHAVQDRIVLFKNCQVLPAQGDLGHSPDHLHLDGGPADGFSVLLQGSRNRRTSLGNRGQRSVVRHRHRPGIVAREGNLPVGIFPFLTQLQGDFFIFKHADALLGKHESIRSQRRHSRQQAQHRSQCHDQKLSLHFVNLRPSVTPLLARKTQAPFILINERQALFIPVSFNINRRRRPGAV